MTVIPIKLTDVTLRDGLQMEAKIVSTPHKLALLKNLQQCPYQKIELTSFVSPKWVPQFADTDAFCQAAFATPWPESGPRAMAFVPNEQGLDRLLRYPIPWISCFIATSETFNQKNVNQSVSDTLLAVEKIIRRGHAEKRQVRVYISTFFGCPYEGDQTLSAVTTLFRKVAALGPDEIALGDTIGVASPNQVSYILSTISGLFPVDRVALHFHNTYGLAVACVEAGLAAGISSFDGSTGGIGGCPYAKGATGNVPLETLLYGFFREKRISKFPKDAVRNVLNCLEQELELKITSPLFDIQQKGGLWYAVE